MKLRNKKTGEIFNFTIKAETDPTESHFKLRTGSGGWEDGLVYGSLEELNEEWEDVPEEPKRHWAIDTSLLDGDLITDFEDLGCDWQESKEIGNYFETKEEAEKAVEKLKAVAKLKEFGFRFIDWELDMKTVADGKIWFDIGINTEWNAERLLELKPEVKESLDTLFGGEE